MIRVENMKLKRRSNGCYYVYYHRSLRVSLRTKDRDVAKDLFEEKKREVRDGKITALDKVRRIRLSEFIREYLDERDSLVMLGGRDGISQGTRKNDEKGLRKFLSFIGDVPLRSLGRKHLDDFRMRLLTLGKGTDARRNYIDTLVRPVITAFNTAVRHGYIDRNPFVRVRGERWRALFNVGKGELPLYLEDHEIRALRSVLRGRLFETAVEYGLCLASAEAGEVSGAERWALKALSERWRARRDFARMFDFYLYTGLRPAELVRLTWQDIKLGLNVIHVRKTKTKQERNVAMHPALGRLVEEMGARDLGPVFPRWRTEGTVSRLFKEVRRAAGVDERKKLKSTRHSFATHAIKAGINLKVLQDMMGHASPVTTQIYARVLDAAQQAEIAKLSYGGAEE
jgi:integrase